MNRESFTVYEFAEYANLSKDGAYHRILLDVRDGVIKKIRDAKPVDGIPALYRFTGKEEIKRGRGLKVENIDFVVESLKIKGLKDDEIAKLLLLHFNEADYAVYNIMHTYYSQKEIDRFLFRNPINRFGK